MNKSTRVFPEASLCRECARHLHQVYKQKTHSVSDRALNAFIAYSLIVHGKSLVWKNFFFEEIKIAFQLIEIEADVALYLYKHIRPEPRMHPARKVHSAIIVVQLKYHFAFHQRANVLLIASVPKMHA